MTHIMRIVCIIFFAVISASCLAQHGYKIQCNIEGLKDTTIYLWSYYQDGSYICDTATVNAKGNFTFDGKKPLESGVYFLVLDKTALFEFVVGSNQNFNLTTTTSDYYKNMQVKNDLDNKLFFEHVIFSAARHKEAAPFIKIIQDSILTDEQKKTARETLAILKDKVNTHQRDIISRHPTTVTAKFFNADRPVEIPDPPKKADGSIDSTFQLKWYREHFFDHFDLGDPVSLRLPRSIYKTKVNEYLEKLFVPQRDTVFNAIKKIVAKAKRNPETYKYIVWYCTTKYQVPEIMGLDEVFVDLYDLYFATGEMDFWLNEKGKQNVGDYANRVRLSMLGKTAPDLIMKDASDKLRSLYSMKTKYTLVFFFDPDCGHCRAETPKLIDFHAKVKNRFDLDVFAVSSDSSMTKMRKFIAEMKTPWITVNFYYSAVGHFQHLYDAISMPTLYLLDKNKKIIGKKIPVEKLEEFIVNYERFHKTD
jgi:thiol-disulfide isomerase/thioredoxin